MGAREFGGGADSAGENILGRRHARKRIWIWEPFSSHFPLKIDEQIDAKIDAEKVMKIDKQIYAKIKLFFDTFRNMSS